MNTHGWVGSCFSCTLSCFGFSVLFSLLVVTPGTALVRLVFSFSHSVFYCPLPLYETSYTDRMSAYVRVYGVEALRVCETESRTTPEELIGCASVSYYWLVSPLLLLDSRIFANFW